MALAQTHTTVSVERAVLRLAGVQGADPDGIPWVNRLVDAVREQVGLEHGVALPVWDALRAAARRRHRAGPAGLVRRGALPGARGTRRRPGRGAPRAGRAAGASARSTGAGASASRSYAASATRRGSRGST